jgi:energy-converting hydrogenase B subunit D
LTEFLQASAVLLTVACAVAVVMSRNVVKQAVVLGFYGTALTLMLVVYQMPDVALSQLAVGAIPPPLLLLLALARMRRIDEKRREQKHSQSD